MPARKYQNNSGSEYGIWRAMKQRCRDKNSINYPRYGGKGVSVCAKWINDFEAFYSDMGPRPSPDHQIDRIDSNGDYEPVNCRWVDKYEQANNKSDNVILIVDGKKVPRGKAIRDSGLPYPTVVKRLKMGWSVEDALTVPVGSRSARHG